MKNKSVMWQEIEIIVVFLQLYFAKLYEMQ
jgi:hypothetical protein